MGKKQLSIGQWLAVAVVASIIPAFGLWMAYHFYSARQASDATSAPLLVPAPLQNSLALPRTRESGEILLYSFSPELREAYIHDIVVDNERIWIGSGKGLLAYSEGAYAIQYRQFSHAPFEWVRELSLENGLLATDVLVARDSTGGTYAGNYLFDVHSKTWQILGHNVISQTWLNGVLWQRPLDRTLNKFSLINDQWVSEDIPIQSRLCSEAYMRAIDNEIWIAQQGTVHFHFGVGIQGTSSVKAIPCGVLRYKPQTGEEILYEEDDGLNSGFGRDVVGDGDQVWVSHSIKHEKLSLFDPQTGQWQSARPYGSGNRIALSKRAVWLASPSSSSPLIRIDRATQSRRDIKGIPGDYYVSAIAVEGDEVWLGLYKKTYSGKTYSIDSYLAKYIDHDEAR